MPIKIPESLPARSILESENIFVMTEGRAVAQDIRPLRIAILNLMPTKIVTETQLARLLSNTPLQVELTLLYTTTHRPTHTPGAHLDAFYRDFESVRHENFDGLIVTGAPVENLEFGDVDYWRELCDVMDFARTNVFSTIYICWAAQAALYYYHGIPKYPLDSKMFGVFSHKVLAPTHMLVRGFDEYFNAPHSRHTEVRSADINACPDLQLLAESDEAGAYLVAERETVFRYGDHDVRGGNIFFVTGHSEYDADTLSREYFRDRDKGLPIAVPKHYFPNDDPSKKPANVWRSHAHLLFTNWLNYFVYQMTPFDLDEIGHSGE